MAHPAYATVHERIKSMRLEFMDSFSIVDPEWDDEFDPALEPSIISDLEEEALIKEAGHVW